MVFKLTLIRFLDIVVSGRIFIMPSGVFPIGDIFGSARYLPFAGKGLLFMFLHVLLWGFFLVCLALTLYIKICSHMELRKITRFQAKREKVKVENLLIDTQHSSSRNFGHKRAQDQRELANFLHRMYHLQTDESMRNINGGNLACPNHPLFKESSNAVGKQENV